LASIRLKGKLNKWVDDKGFGFITPEKNNKNVFIHISAFDRANPRRPKAGDTIFYHVKTDKSGKTKAVDASIEGVASTSRKAQKSRPTKQFRERRPRNSWKLAVVCLIVLIAGGSMLMKRFQSTGTAIPNFISTSGKTNQSSRFTCSGKTHCSEMTSCAEAKFYINNCPGTKMDGDGDGTPCESQWCK